MDDNKKRIIMKDITIRCGRFRAFDFDENESSFYFKAQQSRDFIEVCKIMKLLKECLNQKLIVDKKIEDALSILFPQMKQRNGSKINNYKKVAIPEYDAVFNLNKKNKF